MEKKSLLGVHKRKPIKRVKKNLLKKVADYLISDSYLFAPLISPQPNIFPPSSNYSSFLFFFLFFFQLKFDFYSMFLLVGFQYLL